MKTTLEVLTEARALIEDEGAHCRRIFYRSRGGTVSYCAVGAVARAADGNQFPTSWSPIAQRAIDALARAVDGKDEADVFEVNDNQSHSRTIAMFDSAIANEQAKAQEFEGVGPIPRYVPEMVGV